MTGLWGPYKDLDYWTARLAGLVPPEERRAMAFLASMTDGRRLSLYCMTGQMPAMGNATKRIYLVRRYATVLELDDGRPSTSWCIHARERHMMPETDHIVAVKSLIEGEEWVFRTTGNPSPAGHSTAPAGMRNPLMTPFLDEHERALSQLNADLADFTGPYREREQTGRALTQERDQMRSVAAFRGKLWSAVARRAPTPDMAAAEWARAREVRRAVALHRGIPFEDVAGVEPPRRSAAGGVFYPNTAATGSAGVFGGNSLLTNSTVIRVRYAV